jgi:transposase
VAVHGKTFLTIFRRKEPFGTIFINGDAMEHGTTFTIRCGKRFVLPPGVNRRPVREALIPKVSSRLGRQGREDSMREKKINGIKRHIMVDTVGLLLIVVVHAASIQDRDGAKLVFAKVKHRFPRLRLIWADGGYAGKLIDYVYYWYSLVLQIVKRSDDQKGFVLLPRRWVVERTFGWLMNYRRLCRNYEYWTETSETVVKVAMIHIMLRRLA